MKQDQILLLLALKESRVGRRAASMSCNQHRDTAEQLDRLGFVEMVTMMQGAIFYRITDAGIKALEKIE